MNPMRRRFLRIATGAVLAVPAVARSARADTYPARPVRIVVAYTPGAGQDLVARLIGQWLSERLGQPFIVENRPGAGTNIGTELVARAPADGHTLLWIGAPSAINATLYAKLSFNFVRDIAPVANIIHVPHVLAVNTAFPAKTIPEFIAYAKKHPDKINMGSSGNGSTPHVMGELFRMMTGITMTHVPYRGLEPAQTDLMGGQIQVVFTSLPSAIGYIKSGQLQALGVTTPKRSPALPDVPAIAEFVPGYEATGWQGIGAPQKTPPEIIDRLNAEINAGIADPKIGARLAELGGVPAVGTASDFKAFIADETEKWGRVVKASGARAD